jgi:hypothetical protein
MSQIALRKLIASTTDLASIVGKLGDVGVDITKKTLVIFDGTTGGGVPLALENHTHANANATTAGFESAADYIYLYNHTHPNATTSVAGFMSAADKLKLDGLSGGGGPSSPQSSANIPNTLVLRDSSGNFAANVITAASFVGALTGNAATVTNGVYTSGSYADPSWITSLNANKLTGVIPSGVSFAGTIPWSSVTGKPTVVSYFVNDAGYINGSGNTTGTSGGVQSSGGRETSNATANTVIIRDSNARAQIATPLASGDIANKAYVDANTSNVSYYPQAVVSGPDWNDGSHVSGAFTSTVLNDVSQAGFIHAITFNTQGVGAQLYGASNAYHLFLGITIDGKPEWTESWANIQNFYRMVREFNVSNQGNSWLYQWYPDLPYKQSCVIRMFSDSGWTLGTSAPLWIIVSRYFRAL